MTKHYTPQVDSVPYKVIALLAADPAMRLVTCDELSAKFGRHHSAFHTLLAPAVQARYLERQTNAEDELVYGLGPVASGIAAEPVPVPDVAPAAAWAAPRQPAKPRKTQSDPFVCDTSKIVLKSGVPVPVGRTAQGTDWALLLGRMAQGQCCELPAEALSSLGGAVTRARKAGEGVFKIRKLSPETLGLWRVG